MSDQLMELDLWWILSGWDVAADKQSKDVADVAAYHKYLHKCFWITAKIHNTIELHICAQYTANFYNENPWSIWAS